MPGVAGIRIEQRASKIHKNLVGVLPATIGQQESLCARLLQVVQHLNSVINQ